MNKTANDNKTAKDVLYIEDGVLKIREGVKPSEGVAFLTELFNEQMAALRAENQFRGVLNESFANYLAHIKQQTLGFEQELFNFVNGINPNAAAEVADEVAAEATAEQQEEAPAST